MCFNYTSRKFYNLLRIKGFFRGLIFCLGHGIMEWWNIDAFVKSQNHVTPAKAGVHNYLISLDSCFRRNDKQEQIGTSNEVAFEIVE